MDIINKTKHYLSILKPLTEKGLSSKEISNITGLGQKHIQKILLKFDLPRLKQGARMGQDNPSWKGGKTIDKDGYVLYRNCSHPNSTFSGYVREHRLVMEKHLGRFLTSEEVVHHKNGIKTDNRLENLELFAKNSEHLKKELKGKIPNWSLENKEKLLKVCRQNAKNRLSANL